MAEINGKPVALIGATVKWGADNINHLDLGSFNFEPGLTEKGHHINNGEPGEPYQLSKRVSTVSFRAKVARNVAGTATTDWYNAMQSDGLATDGTPATFDVEIQAKMNFTDTVVSRMVLDNAIVKSCPVGVGEGFLGVTVTLEVAAHQLKWIV